MSIEYEVTVFVEDSFHLWPLYKSLNITLEGTKGKSEATWYHQYGLPFFRRNEIKFPVKCSDDLGYLVNIKLDKSWSVFSQSPWYHVKVEVESPIGTIYTFPIHQSISSDKEHFFREGKAMLPQKEKKDELSKLRQKEIKDQQKIYGWKEFAEGMPHCLDAEILPLDESFSSSKNIELGFTKFGTFQLNWTKCFERMDMLRNLDQIEDLQNNHTSKFSRYVMNNWRKDSFFGSQFLNGLNPMVIRCIKSLPEQLSVKDDMVMPDGSSSLKSEMEAGNIFLCDYSILNGVETNTINGKKQYLTAPLVLLYKNKNEEMMPIAIQLKQNPGEDNPVFFPSDSENDWLLAKMYVRSADFNLHELNYHLLRTHLLAEVFAVSLKRNLPRVHPVYKILIRHTRYTLQINLLARQRLISKDGIFTKFTASGGDGMVTILKKFLSNLTYSSLCIPDDIKERGLENVKNFYYRDDGLKLWEIMHSFVEETLSYYYEKDIDVEEDGELQNWIKEIFEHGFLKKNKTEMPKNSRTEEEQSGEDPEIPQSFKTKKELFKFVTMVMFTCSAQHAAVNSGQYDFYGWIANSPSTMQEPPPTKKETVDEARILKSLPDIDTIKSMATVWLLSTQACDSSFLPDFQQKYFTENVPCDKIRIFQTKLLKLSKDIKQRNEGLDLPYTFLDPKAVENSVSI